MLRFDMLRRNTLMTGVLPGGGEAPILTMVVGSGGQQAYLLDSRHDRVMKTLVSTMDDFYGGTVEAPCGYFTMSEINDGIYEYLRNDPDLFDQDDADNLPAEGWYVTRENDQGLIWVYAVADRDEAQRLFDGLMKTYAAWQDQDDDESGDPDPDSDTRHREGLDEDDDAPSMGYLP